MSTFPASYKLVLFFFILLILSFSFSSFLPPLQSAHIFSPSSTFCPSTSSSCPLSLSYLCTSFFFSSSLFSFHSHFFRFFHFTRFSYCILRLPPSVLSISSDYPFFALLLHFIIFFSLFPVPVFPPPFHYVSLVPSCSTSSSFGRLSCLLYSLPFSSVFFSLFVPIIYFFCSLAFMFFAFSIFHLHFHVLSLLHTGFPPFCFLFSYSSLFILLFLFLFILWPCFFLSLFHCFLSLFLSDLWIFFCFLLIIYFHFHYFLFFIFKCQYFSFFPPFPISTLSSSPLFLPYF